MRPLIALLVTIVLVMLVIWWWPGADEPVEESLALPPAPEVETAPLVRHPLPAPAPREETEPEQLEERSELTRALPDTLPEIDRSDEVLFSLVEYLIRNPQLAELLAPRDLIRRFVITVDGLGTRAVPLDHVPVTMPGGRFLAEEENERITIDPRNYERYRHHIALLDQLDTDDLIEAYVHFYPLFQQAWRDLGYPQGFFNDRLIEVIDEVLATPDLSGSIRLEQPSVWYVYRDPEIEALSAGQRLLIRMGPDNSEMVKRKLREIRAALVR